MNLLKICAGWLIISSLSGCAHNPAIVPNPVTASYEQNLLITERNKIFAVYDKNIPNNIILAYEKIYGNTFDIAKNYLQYNKEDNNPTTDGFWIWLVRNLWYKNIFDKGDEFGTGKWLIDNRFNCKDYIEIEKNYELLERVQDEKD